MDVLELSPESALEAARAIRASCQPLPDPVQSAAFGAYFETYADARVILLGEASHGTSEFYRARAAITRTLIEHHGFNIVAVEADWPDAARVDRYVRHRPAGAYDEASFARFPAWMWRNREVDEFVAWLRAHNETLPAERRVEFRGLDIYSLQGSIAAVLSYLDRNDPEAARAARDRYGCLTPWHGDHARYGWEVLSGEKASCEDDVVAALQAMLARQVEQEADDPEEFADAAQNARIVRAAEQYYRFMYKGSNESWNLRDRHMFETLQQVMARRGSKAKAVIWAHNSHIGDAAATSLGWRGQFNVGELCRTAYGNAAVLIGFGTDRGVVAAADDWDEPVQFKTIIPSRPDSYERVFRHTGLGCSLTDLRSAGAVRDALSQPRLERAIGVIYRPESELQSHYFEAVLPEQFDAYVFFEETSPITPLPAQTPHGVPETYPFGV